MRLDIAFCFSDLSGDYYKNIMTVMSEILSHTGSTVAFHILHDETLHRKEHISAWCQQHNAECIFYDISNEEIIKKYGEYAQIKGMLYRLLIPKYCTELKKVLYLDGDVVVWNDISPLYMTDIEEYTLGAVLDVEKTRRIFIDNYFYRKLGIFSNRYFNSGVLLMNLAKLRAENDIVEEFIRFIRQHNNCLFADQDYLNYRYQNYTMFLDNKYNYISENINDELDGISNKCVVLHAAGSFKPWNCRNKYVLNYFCHHYANIYGSEQERFDAVIDYMSALPDAHFRKLGLKHSLLQQPKDGWLLSLACIIKGLCSDDVYNLIAYFIMFRLKNYVKFNIFSRL